MNFDLDDNQLMFRDTVERFCAPVDVARRHTMRRMDGGFDRNRWKDLADLGLVALALSESDGGLGGSLLDCAIVAQAMGRGLAVEPWTECGFLATRLLAGSAYVEGISDGSQIAAFAFAEPQGRYVLEAKSVSAQGGRLNGEKTFVLSAASADLLIVSAQEGGVTKLFVVDAHADGVDIRPYPVVDGSLAGVVTFRNVAAQPVADMARIESAVDETRLIAAAEMVGLAKRLFDDTLEYVKTREQFGQPIGRFQVIQHRLVDAYAKLEAMQSSLYRALLLPGQDRAATKAFIAENGQWIAEQAVQLHGGMGMTDELTIGHGVKRLLLLSKLFGDPASAIAAMAKAA
jgi:alkylation response protein AidB-like acyl-CoA dehydrogenase